MQKPASLRLRYWRTSTGLDMDSETHTGPPIRFLVQRGKVYMDDRTWSSHRKHIGGVTRDGHGQGLELRPWYRSRWSPERQLEIEHAFRTVMENPEVYAPTRLTRRR